MEACSSRCEGGREGGSVFQNLATPYTMYICENTSVPVAGRHEGGGGGGRERKGERVWQA